MQFSRPLPKDRSRRYTTRCQSVWNSRRSRAIQFNRHLPYISKFQGYNSKDRLSNDAMCDRPFPNFHTSDLWSRTCDRLVSYEERSIGSTSVCSRFHEYFELPAFPSTSIHHQIMDTPNKVDPSRQGSSVCRLRDTDEALAVDSKLLSSTLMRSLMRLYNVSAVFLLFDTNDSAHYGISNCSSIDAHLRS